MSASLKRRPLSLAILLACSASTIHASPAKKLDQVQVTATRQEEKVDQVPASITVITAEDLRARGAHDLRTALALVAGVEISPGGDSGPAGTVPAFWGLREFDAFLLVVDGVPYGGAFNPALTTLDLTNVERIEVLRGAAPVMYGATSFVGVIHVLHNKAGATENRVEVGFGTFGTITGSAIFGFGSAEVPQSLTVDAEQRDFKDEDAGVSRGHILYRTEFDLGDGKFGLDIDGTIVNQDPTSPSPRAGPVLDPNVPIDANHNPSDAKLDEDRFQLNARFAQAIAWGDWNTTLSFAHTNGDIVRGFLAPEYDASAPIDANGYAQDRKVTDVYFDTHVVTNLSEGLDLSYGFDWLYGKAELKNELFDYYVPLDGANRPSSRGLTVLDEPEAEDERNFLGAYVQADWNVSDRVDILAGLRINHTREEKDGESDESGSPQPASDERTKTRLGGVLGASFHVWRDGNDGVTLYADVRNTYKPAAFDFGPEAEAEILKPETAVSYEAGVKGQFLDGALDWDLSTFYMNFDNLVVTQAIDGRPGLVNAGEERFKGAELEVDYRLATDLRLAGHWAYHDARFGDYVNLFGETPTQLRNRFLELSPQHLSGLGLVYAPAQGFEGALVGNYVGERFLNKRNTAPTGSYTTVDASLGYRWGGQFEVRLDGRNLSDRRDPVTESELGDAQYYRLPARTVEVSFGMAF